MTCSHRQVHEQMKNYLRPSNVVMQSARLGALFPNRLSFSRSLLRRMARENWSIERECFDLNHAGIGVATYKIHTSGDPVWFVVFANHLDNKS